LTFILGTDVVFVNKRVAVVIILDNMLSGARVSSMRDERKFGAEARSNQELPEQTQLDIMKVLEQCGIHPDNWKRFVQKMEKGTD